MSITFPRDMITGLCWESTRLVLQHRQQLSRTAGGLLTAQDLGPPVWTAPQVSTYPMDDATADLYMADFQALRGAVNSFYFYDTRRRRPVAAQTDAQFDLSGVTVAAISASRDAISLTGLPAGFEMTSGDYVSVTTSVGGRELFRVARARQAEYDGLGTTPEMEVAPHVRATVQVGDDVDLIKPLVEMRLEPGSLDDPYVNRRKRRITFSAVQVIR